MAASDTRPRTTGQKGKKSGNYSRKKLKFQARPGWSRSALGQATLRWAKRRQAQPRTTRRRPGCPRQPQDGPEQPPDGPGQPQIANFFPTGPDTQKVQFEYRRVFLFDGFGRSSWVISLGLLLSWGVWGRAWAEPNRAGPRQAVLGLSRAEPGQAQPGCAKHRQDQPRDGPSWSERPPNGARQVQIANFFATGPHERR